jgi:ribosomal protein L24E
MWKYLLIAVAVFVLYKLFVNERGKSSDKADREEKKERERKIASGELVKDPCCGTYVGEGSGIMVRDGETLHHFCSYECRKKFLDKLEEEGREIPKLDA